MALRKIRIRRSTAAEWQAFNPVLDSAELALDTTNRILKIGDGVTSWSSLPVYAEAPTVGATIDWANVISKPSVFPPDVHTHVSADITDLLESVQDVVGAMIAAGTGIGVAYNDAAGTVTISNTASGGTTDQEVVRDTIGVALQGAGPITITVDDAGNTITIASAATVNQSDAYLLSRANHTGTQSADSITDGTTNKAYTATEKTKLAGVATGATANSSDAVLEARANHTGTQAHTTISDWDTELRKTEGLAFYSGGAYPLRSTVTSDSTRRVRWVGPTTPTFGGGYAISGFDVWEKTP